MPAPPQLAPVVLFTYNRPATTREAIQALLKNDLAPQSELHIYSDGPKRAEDVDRVEELRRYFRTIEGFAKVVVVERERNVGLFQNITDGVTAVVGKYGKIIVLEDDILASSNFLLYMNEALEKYRSNPRVYSITGYSFTDGAPGVDNTYFLRLTSSWSWATWADRWKVFRKAPESLAEKLRDPEFRRQFDYNGCFEFSKLAEADGRGEINSWAIHWYASVFERDGLTLYPARRLVQNIGHDGSGIHCGSGGNETKPAPHEFRLTDEVMEKRCNRLAVEGSLSKRRPRRLRYYLGKGKREFDRLLSPRSRTCLSQTTNWARSLLSEKSVGSHAFVDKTVHITGWRCIRIGHHSVISGDSWLNVNNRGLGEKQIVIGNNCYIGFRNFFTSGRLIEVGDFVMTGIDCKFLGSNHVADDPFAPYITTGTTHDSVMRIGVNVWMGAGVSVLGSVVVGHGSVIGAGAFVTRSIPPFSIAYGNPCKVVKRFDFSKKEWIPADQLTPELEARMPSEDDYREQLTRDYPEISIPLLAASRSFGDIY